MKRHEITRDCETCPVREQSVFHSLLPGEVKTLSMAKACNVLKRGDVIFHEGMIPHGLYILARGKVKLYKLGIDGKEQIVRLAREGELLGYRSVISGENYAASAAVLEEAMICFLPKERLFQFITGNPQLSIEIMNLFARDLKAAEDRLTHMAQDSVRERLAQTLLLLNETYGSDGDTGVLKVKLTREDLAGIIGTAVETTIRLLSEFQRDGLIKVDRREISLLDKEKLKDTARIWD